MTYMFILKCALKLVLKNVLSLGRYDVIIVRVLFYSIVFVQRSHATLLLISITVSVIGTICLFTVAHVRCCVVGRVIVSNRFHGTC